MIRSNKKDKEVAKEIHKAEHRFVEGKMSKEHKWEEYYYLLGSIVMNRVLNKIEEEGTEVYNKIVDLEERFEKLEEIIKEVAKQQKYLWQTLEETSKDKLAITKE